MTGERVVIVGGGVIGLASACELARVGLDVTVLEQSEIGHGCSFGNAGWVTPAISLPIAAPGLRARGLSWFLRPDSPLYIRPTALPGLASWLWQFFKLCTKDAFDRAADSMLPFASDAVELYRGWLEEMEGIEWQQTGLLMVFRSRRGLEQELSLLEQTGYGPIRQLTANDLVDLEPALSTDNLSGGIHVAPEGQVEPLSVTRALGRRCLELGVVIREGFRVEGIHFEPGSREVRKVRSVSGGNGEPVEIETDHLVLATGAEAGLLSRACGTRIPLQAGKGYSITISEPAVEIQHAIYLADAKVGVSPFEGALRIAGALELSGINTRLDRRRLHGFERAAEREIPGVSRGPAGNSRGPRSKRRGSSCEAFMREGILGHTSSACNKADGPTPPEPSGRGGLWPLDATQPRRSIAIRSPRTGRHQEPQIPARGLTRFPAGPLGGGARREWVGMRPMTPDGMPVIGKLASADNVWLNTGHQMLGMTLAPRSALLLGELMIHGEAPSPYARAFSPSRFQHASA